MNSLILFLLSGTFTFICAGHIAAQTMNDEIARLRAHLSVSDSIQVNTSSAPILPKEYPLKVYIATGLDMVVHNNFVRWINEWNRKDGKKYGALEIVEDLNQANIILARYTLKDQVTTQQDSVTVENTTILLSSSRAIVPVYAYIIRRQPQRLEILSRYAESAPAKDDKHSGEPLVKGFFKMIKVGGSRK